MVYPRENGDTTDDDTRYPATVYLDVDTHFMGYDPAHRLAEVDTFTVEAEHPHDAAEEMFRIGQKGSRGPPLPRRRPARHTRCRCGRCPSAT